MDIKNTLFELSNSCSLGNITEARDIAYDILCGLTDSCQKTDNLTVLGKIKGESDYTLMLAAHIDEIGFTVTDIDDKGFVTVAKCGGIDLRTLPAKRVTIHGKEKVTGVFCSTPPHLAEGEQTYEDINKIKIDTLLGEKAKEVISLGDFVTFKNEPYSLCDTLISGKSFDDRAGVVSLLLLAEKLKGEKLPISVIIALTDMEELGTRGAKTACFKVNPDEAIAIDVSFGNAPDVNPTECGKLGEGAMVGVAPVLSKPMSNKLIKTATEKNIPHQIEVMGGRTGTDADALSISREGVPSGVVSIPLRNMHTDNEIIDTRDIQSVSELLKEYILKGGLSNV
ncbi:MAG: M20/M25/M40 family metallo-hydrolase [Clostridia bacterium]|nr:M20/M25/M40 family metallo-hydrolase [Clostridia bacterium]